MNSIFVVAPLAIAVAACRDTTSFGTKGDHFEGTVVAGKFVRAGFNENTRMCVTLDAERLQEKPGQLRTDDARFVATELRPIPELWHDPLSNLSFGDGRIQNFVYVVSPLDEEGGVAADAQVVLSLMQTGDVEVRVMRGASPSRDALFGVFQLQRRPGACSF